MCICVFMYIHRHVYIYIYVYRVILYIHIHVTCMRICITVTYRGLPLLGRILGKHMSLMGAHFLDLRAIRPVLRVHGLGI